MNSQYSSQKPDVTLSLSLPSTTNTAPSPPPAVEDKAVTLIQLLLTCATHAASGNLHRADECLRRISELTSGLPKSQDPPSGGGRDSIYRLATWFASALAVRLVKRWPGVYKALNHRASETNLRRARRLFAESLPYMSIAYSIINRTLIQALSGQQKIHIVDLGSGDPNLWVLLLRNLGSSENRAKNLKITSINSDNTTLENLKTIVTKEAQILKIPFQFEQNPNDLNIDSIKSNPNEALAFVSVSNLHVLLAEDDQINTQFSPNNNKNIKNSKKLDEFLIKLRSLSPKLLISVEQESDHNTQRLVDRLVMGLRYYSAMFDSIDAAFGGGESEERGVVEEMIGKEIENVVACEGLERVERHERFGKWTARISRAGFRPVRLWVETMDDDVKRFVGDDEKFNVRSHKGCLMICWCDRPMYSVSAWTCFD